MALTENQILHAAGMELNAVHAAGLTPRLFEKAVLPDAGTPIHDMNGEVLFHRISVMRGRRRRGYVDVAAHEVFAEPLLAVVWNARWNETAMKRAAVAAARRRRPRVKFDEVRFVAWSYPKIGVQFLADGREALLLELRSWAEPPPVERGARPPRDEKSDAPAPGNFERWSYIDEASEESRRRAARSMERRLALWSDERLSRIDPTRITRTAFEPANLLVKMTETKELHYAPRAADHHICYELRGQQTPVWCVAASVEMLLNFYRYGYAQPRLAEELDLGDCDDPNGLPYGQEYKVVNTIERLTSNALNAAMDPTPDWPLFMNEIRANRPLISFVPGHSRTVAGYTRSLLHLLGELPYRGLLVYDPWPPTDCEHPEAGGVITRWENFGATTYRHAFSAALRHV